MKLAELLREYLQQLKEKYKNRLLPSHHRAIQAILTCRTPKAGILLIECPTCHRLEIHPKSCGHRNCPVCQNYETGVWLERQMQKLLPIPYFMVTFTIPENLRSIAWQNQRLFFGAMFVAGAAALRELDMEERYLGEELGFTGVLHTHSRMLDFHPHIHFVVPTGAIEVQKRLWKRKDWHFLFPTPLLAHSFDKVLLAHLKSAGIDLPLVPGRCEKIKSLRVRYKIDVEFMRVCEVAVHKTSPKRRLFHTFREDGS